MFKKILLVIICSLPLVVALLHSGYFPSHDGEWAVVRLGEMTRTLRDGQFPARWSFNLNYGYGYPLFNFTYPLPYYLGTVFYLAKFGLMGSLKTMFFLSVPLSAVFMFLASRKFTKSDLGAFMSAMLYVYFPYRIVDLYVRGSIGESLSFVLFPIIIWLLKKEKFILSAVFYAALILTHNIMSVVFTPVILAILVLDLKNKYKYLGFFVLSYALSAFFWIPAIFEKNLILLSKIPIADRALYFLKPLDLFIPKWGYGVPTDPNGFGYFLGFSQLTILTVIFILFKKQLWPFVLLTLFYLFMLFSVSDIFWKNLPLFKEINYPWTLLAPLGFVLSLLAPLLIKNKIITVSLILLAIIVVLPYAKPSGYLSTTDNYYLTNDATTTSSSELMPLWVKEFPTSRPDTTINSKQTTLIINSKTQINQIYFPGWEAYVNGKRVDIKYNNPRGLMELPIEGGGNTVKLNWTETPLRLGADFISLGSLALATVLLLKNWRPLASIKKWQIPNQQKDKR